MLRERNILVCGVGINDANYTVKVKEIINGKRKQVWICPFYQRWMNMLTRCYSERVQSKRPTYLGCSVYSGWFTFSNFRVWMETQDWDGKELDKDLLIIGNKVYSPDTCIFVHPKVNSFTTDSGGARGEYMIGVFWHKDAGKFQSQCWNPLTGNREYLGLFNTELEAHMAWKTRKHELACQLAESEYIDDPRLAEALRTRYL